MRVLRIDSSSPYQQLVGVGGMGTGIFFALEGDHSLGRSESRPGQLLNVRDYCKLHIIVHYVARLLGARHSGLPFHVLPVGNIGDDPPGHSVLREMSDVGIDTRLVRTVSGKPTLFSVCFQYPGGDGGNITTSNSAAAALTDRDLDGIEGVLAAQGKHTVALAAPEVSLAVRRRLLDLATGTGALRVASFVAAEIPQAKDSGMLHVADLISLNKGEAGELVGQQFAVEEADRFADACLKFLHGNYPKLRMVVTVGEHGAYAFGDGMWNYAPAPAVKVASTAGAGDALLAGVIAALATGLPLLRPASRSQRMPEEPIETALEFGVLLASLKCLSPHTIHPDASMDVLLQFAKDAGIGFADQLRGRIAEVALAAT